MKAMLDLNVLLDVVQRREPHFGGSCAVLAAAARGAFTALLSSHSLATLHCIVAKHAGQVAADAAIDWVLTSMQIQAAEHATCLRARALRMPDFEDALIAASSEAARCRCIVTRNVRDFGFSPVPALTPEEFLAGISRK